jgi:tRNA A-37 threonylcarbamoyl transferase component Bud32
MIERLRAALADRYEVLEQVGEGGMAVVYLARDRKHDRRVAVKVLRPELAAAVGAERFLREIEISAALRHPHIMPLFDSGEAGGFLFYVMPFVEGESLRARVQRERQLPLDDAVRITLQVADALAYAHSRGVVHRDIKPENILLESGHAVVADFGVSRAIADGPGGRLTKTGLALGTPAYMSPEQASGDGIIDGRTDLYALGCVLYELLAGEPPHTGPTPQSILARSLTTTVRPLQPVRATVTPALEAVVQKALAPTAADRYATCHEFAEALRAAVSGIAAPTPDAVRPVSAAQRARRLLGPLLAVVVLGGLIVLARRVIGPTTAVAVGRPAIAVFPFRATTVGAEEWSEALGDLLATALDGTPGLSVADPWALWRPLRAERAARAAAPDPLEANRLARNAGARRFVLGSAVETGGRLAVTVRIYNAGETEPAPPFLLTDSAGVGDLSALVQRLAVAVIQRVAEEEHLPDVRDVRGYTTGSADALKAYLDARGALRRGLVDSAERAIDRAIAQDSGFTLALVEGVRIKSWAQFLRGEPFRGLGALTARAVRQTDSLSERNRLRAIATHALVRTDGPTAAAAARRILELDGTDIEAWDLLSYTHQAYGWQYGAGVDDMLDAVERVVALDGTYLPVLVRRSWAAAAAGDPADVSRQMDRLARSDTTVPLIAATLSALRAAAADDDAFTALLPDLATRPADYWLAAFRMLRSSRPARAERLVEARLAGAPGVDRTLPMSALLQLWLGEGRIRAVDSLVRGGALDATLWLRRAAEFHLVAANLAGVGDPDVARGVVDSLAVWFLPDSALAQFQTRPIWRAAWTIGAHHAAGGDTMLTRRWRDALGRLPRDGGLSQDWVGALQADFDARIAARRGDPETALTHARRAYQLWTVHSDNVPEGDPEPAMRLHLALLHLTLGRPDSAEVYLRSLVPPTTWMGFLTARASYELGQIAERRREYVEAAVWYARARALWDRGGEEVADWRARAAEGVTRVTRRAG